jgi:hypothetical protein
MKPRRSTDRLVLSLALGIAMTGCAGSGDNLPREPITGNVTMDGQPLPEGVIQFSPTGDATKGAAVGANADIKDGQFSIPREQGLIPGNYKIAISHAALTEEKAKGKTNTKVDSKIPSRTTALGPEQIPARYNTQSELKTEIKPGGGRDLKYDLKSK